MPSVPKFFSRFVRKLIPINLFADLAERFFCWLNFPRAKERNDFSKYTKFNFIIFKLKV